MKSDLENGFTTDWLRAPESYRRYTEMEIAEYYWLKGRQFGKNEAAEETHADLKEMARITQLRTGMAR